MSVWKQWPIWGRALHVSLIAYSALLGAVSVSVFVQSLQHHWTLKLIDILLQSLMLLLLPMLIIGIWNIRLAATLLFLGAAANLGLLLTVNRFAGNGNAAMVAGSLLFLGTPMLAAAVLFRILSPIVAKSSNSSSSENKKVST